MFIVLYDAWPGWFPDVLDNPQAGKDKRQIIQLLAPQLIRVCANKKQLYTKNVKDFLLSTIMTPRLFNLRCL